MIWHYQIPDEYPVWHRLNPNCRDNLFNTEQLLFRIIHDLKNFRLKFEMSDEGKMEARRSQSDEIRTQFDEIKESFESLRTGLYFKTCLIQLVSYTPYRKIEIYHIGPKKSSSDRDRKGFIRSRRC